MSDTLKNITERFSCRDFSSEMPDDGQIHAIAQAALRAPSGMNRQPWQVIVIKSGDLISELEEEGMQMLAQIDEAAYQRIMSRGGKLFYNAPCMILFAVKKAQPEGTELVDLGIAAQNAVLAATSLGLGSLHCGLIGFAFAGEKAESFKQKLLFPDGYECGLAVLIGHSNVQGAPHEPDQSKLTYIY